jgi:phosphoribosylformylglycinamidine synthase
LYIEAVLVVCTDMQVVKVGGPVYRIGVGGGAASSVQVQGDNKVELDFRAVQRGDAEMEQKMNRVVRACVEQGADNPICSIHDQGAGGNGKKIFFLSFFFFVCLFVLFFC